MKLEINESLMALTNHWKVMQLSDLENMELDSDRFGQSYYSFIDRIHSWIETIDNKPSIRDALQMPYILEIMEKIPEPLRLNFETELDYMLAGIERVEATSFFG